MRSDVARKIVSATAAVLLLSIAYYGSYLPLRKSRLFISAMRGLESVRSVGDLKRRFAAALDAPSPIGQEELVRNFGSFALSTAERIGRPEVTKELLQYTESYFGPLIARGRGMSFNQNLYVLGAMNEIAFTQTKDQKHLVAAERYFKESLEIGPRRPQALYGLFDVYRLAGSASGTVAIGTRILDQWPDDVRTRDALAQFLSPPLPSPAKQ